MDLLLDLAERQPIDFGHMSILDLAEQFVAAMERIGVRVLPERRADWLALATRLVLLRSRLLFSDNPKDQREAEQAAAAELDRVEELVFMLAAAGWLTRRPQHPAPSRGAARGRLCRPDGSLPRCAARAGTRHRRRARLQASDLGPLAGDGRPS
jgi:hypothetical protein